MSQNALKKQGISAGQKVRKSNLVAIARAHGLTRIAGLTERIEEHLVKIRAQPHAIDYNHWCSEAGVMIHEVQRLARHVGRRTGAEVLNRVSQWKQSIAERNE